MKKILLLLGSTLLMAAGCQMANNVPQNTATNTIPDLTATTTAAGLTVGQKFSDMDYYLSSYLISDDILSTQAKQALAGFQLSKQTLADGSVQINLKALESGYRDQNYTLKSGEQLYFIDRISGDDIGNKERNQNDDFGVVVNSQGYIVQ